MNSHVGFLIKSISDKIKVHADADLKSHNLTLSQSRILVFLMKKGGSATQKEIEDVMEVSHPTVVGLVARMEMNGFVTFRKDEEDGRNKIVSLTAHAMKIGADMDEVVGLMEDKMLAGLSQKQVEQLTDMLEVIYNNLNR
jgi:DNA-binding MarR family transcriptional regulator